MRTITAQAPTRIDFAGGTLDLPPLYLFHYPAVTVNAAVELFAKATIQESDRYMVISRDQGLEVSWDAGGKAPWERQPKLELILRLVASFCSPQDRPISVTVDAQAPAGSGLGGSSALAIALTAALAHWFGKKFSREELVEYAKSHETQSIKVPTGYQDYWGAVYGSLRAYSMGLDGKVLAASMASPDFHKKLEDHLMLVYVGKPHFSGANNWELFKRHIDGDAATITFFENLRANAAAMQRALVSEDLERVVEALNADWQTRKTMLPQMTTPEIEKLTEAAFACGALALRVCGAGAGGCALLCVKPNERMRLQDHIEQNLHMRVLPLKISEAGVVVSESNN